MQITTYRNASEEHVLDKQLTVVNSGVTAMFKDDTNMINPTIIISSLMSKNFNYVYISDTNRYYYVNDMTYSQQRTFINLSVDVLMSFRGHIMQLPAVVDKQAMKENGDEYIDDGSLVADNVMFTRVHQFASGFNDKPEYILITAG